MKRHSNLQEHNGILRTTCTVGLWMYRYVLLISRGKALRGQILDVQCARKRCVHFNRRRSSQRPYSSDAKNATSHPSRLMSSGCLGGMESAGILSLAFTVSAPLHTASKNCRLHQLSIAWMDGAHAFASSIDRTTKQSKDSRFRPHHKARNDQLTDCTKSDGSLRALPVGP